MRRGNNKEPTTEQSLKNFPAFSKKFYLTGYQLYYQPSLTSKFRYSGIIVRKPYFQYGFSLPMGSLIIKYLNIWKKAANHMVVNAYNYFVVLVALSATGNYALT